MSTIVAFSSKDHGPIEQADFLVVNPAVDEWPKEKPGIIVLPCPKVQNINPKRA